MNEISRETYMYPHPYLICSDFDDQGHDHCHNDNVHNDHDDYFYNNNVDEDDLEMSGSPDLQEVESSGIAPTLACLL